MDEIKDRFLNIPKKQLIQHMIHGMDVWLKNQMHLLESYGISMIKASLNGVIHLSILDCSCIEGFNKKNRWAFKCKDNDEKNVEDNYKFISKNMILLFYNVDGDIISYEWFKVMKEAIKITAPMFSTRRMMKEYAKKFYQNVLKSAGE